MASRFKRAYVRPCVVRTVPSEAGDRFPHACRDPIVMGYNGHEKCRNERKETTVKRPNDVRPFLQHEDLVVRRYALEYFNQMVCEDVDLLPRVLAGLEGLPLKKQRQLVSESSRLTQSPESMEALGRLIKGEPFVRDAAESSFLNAPASLLKEFEEYAALLSYQGQQDFRRKIAVLEINTPELVSRTMQLIDRGQGPLGATDKRYAMCTYLIREICWRPDAPRQELRQWIAQGLHKEDDAGFPVAALAVSAARYLHLTDLGYELLDYLEVDDDWLREEAEQSITALATPELIDKIRRRYPRESWDFRLWSSAVLAGFKHQVSESVALSLLKSERDEDLRAELARALCSLLSMKGIPEVKRVMASLDDTEFMELAEPIYVNCVINGVDDPDLPVWRKTIEHMEANVEAYLDQLGY